MIYNFNIQVIKIIFAIIALIISLLAFYPYLRDIFLKKTKPHVYTWFIWTITQSTAVYALWYGGGGWGAVELTVGTFLVFIIFLFSLTRGTKNVTKSDTIVLFIALLSVLIWWILDNPIFSVIMVSLIDFFGYIPSYRKCWNDPWSETLSTWLLFAIGNIFAIFALNEYNVLTLTYLITIIIGNIILIIISLLRRNLKKSESFKLAKNFLGKEVTVEIDRPLGSKHPKHGFVYEVNYGFIKGVKAPDGEDLDGYFLGINEPIKKQNGLCIAIAHRKDNDDDKLIVVPKGVNLDNEQIMELINFQEKWFDTEIIR
jgi:inorganic pyrophosphatase